MPIRPMVGTQCIFRPDLPCNQDFNEFIGRSTCFIACASSEELNVERESIRKVLLEENIEPIIAADYNIYNQDVLCTKICKNIIGSSFCIVLLTETSYKSKETDGIYKENHLYPNANVYFEYGLMTSAFKYIIPILRRGQALKFDIQNLNLMLYDPINELTLLKFKDQLRAEVRKMISTKPHNFRFNRYLKNVEDELNNNLKQSLAIKNELSSPINNIYVWTNVNDSTRDLSFEFYDQFIRSGMLLNLKEGDDTVIINVYNKLRSQFQYTESSYDMWKTDNFGPEFFRVMADRLNQIRNRNLENIKSIEEAIKTITVYKE